MTDVPPRVGACRACGELQARVGQLEQRIAQLEARLDVLGQPPPTPSRSRSALKPAEILAIRARYLDDETLTYQDLAVEFGRAYVTIAKIIGGKIGDGPNIARPGGRRPAPPGTTPARPAAARWDHPHRADALAAYLTGMRADDVAVAYGVTRDAIYSWYKAAGKPARS